MQLDRLHCVVLSANTLHPVILHWLLRMAVDEEESWWKRSQLVEWSQNISFPLTLFFPTCHHSLALAASSFFLSGSSWIRSLSPCSVCQALRWADSEWCPSGHFSDAGGHFEQILPSVLCPVCGSCGLAPEITAKAQHDRLCVLCAKSNSVGVLSKTKYRK